MHPILGRSLAELFAKADCVQAKYGTTAAVAPTAVVCLRNWRLDELFMIQVLDWLVFDERRRDLLKLAG